MLPVPEASFPAMEICSDTSAAGMIFSARSGDNPAECHLQAIFHGFVVIDHIRHVVDSVNDVFAK